MNMHKRNALLIEILDYLSDKEAHCEAVREELANIGKSLVNNVALKMSFKELSEHCRFVAQHGVYRRFRG